MFLDAATLMHGQPQEHLRMTWVTITQLEYSQLDEDAVASNVSSLLAELLDSSLVTLASTANDQYNDRCALRFMLTCTHQSGASTGEG